MWITDAKNYPYFERTGHPGQLLLLFLFISHLLMCYESSRGHNINGTKPNQTVTPSEKKTKQNENRGSRQKENSTRSITVLSDPLAASVEMLGCSPNAQSTPVMNVGNICHLSIVVLLRYYQNTHLDEVCASGKLLKNITMRREHKNKGFLPSSSRR